MVTKDFDAMLASLGRPTFTVGGQTFTARAKLPWKRFTRLLDLMSEESDDTDGVEKFVASTLIQGDRDRFIALLNAGADDDDQDDDKACIAIQQLLGISEWLMEYYTGKLQENAPSSSDGPASTGRPRKVVSLNARQAAAS